MEAGPMVTTKGKNPQGRIRSFLLDMSRGLENFKQQIEDHDHTQDSSHDEPFPHLRADENTRQIRVRLLSLQDELRTFVHLLEAVEEEAVEKKDAGKDAAEKEVAREEPLEKDEASIGGVHDRFVAHVIPEAVEGKAFGQEYGKQLPQLIAKPTRNKMRYMVSPGVRSFHLAVWKL